MARFTAENTLLAREIIGRYPVAKSALIPLLHLAQQQDGHVSDDAMGHISELVDVTPAEVLGTCSFYEMFKREPVGEYLVTVCTNISCLLNGGEELLGHLEDKLEIRAGSTTRDGLFTLEDVECIAACTEAPCLQVNYRYFHRVTDDDVDRLLDDLRNGRRAHEIPKHGTLSRIRQHIPPDRRAGAASPSNGSEPVWMQPPVEPPPEPIPEELAEPARASARRAGRRWHRDRAPAARRRGRDPDVTAFRRRVVHLAEPTQRRRPMPIPTSPTTLAIGRMITQAPKIITSRFEFDDSYTLTRYEATGGYAGLRKALTMRPEQVVTEVKNASLLGRGGAGFPAGVKWGFCPPGVWPRYLVVNGDESEPGTYKDRMLMERDPHQLIEGALIACYAVGLSQAFLYVRGEMALAQERIAQALNDAYAAGYIGKNILGSDFSVDVVLHWGAGAYIVGEETALIESLEGNRGMPRLKPPFFPAAKGLYMQPTIVNNVETLANLPWIVTNGGSSFAALGAENSRGTRMFAVSGHVKKPGVYEVEFGVTTFRDLLYAPSTAAASPAIASSRRSSPVGRRRPGSSRSTSTCRSRPARSARPGRCSARAPSW